MNNENRFLFKLPEYKEAQRKYNLYPCQLVVLLKLVEHLPKDKNYFTTVSANCKLSDFTFEWCKNLRLIIMKLYLQLLYMIGVKLIFMNST